jgi:DNA-binding CsgD family transcriptional regulator
MRGRKLSFSIALSDGERTELQRWLRSPTMPSGLVARARAILLLSEGMPLKDVLVRCDLTPRTVRQWAKRFIGERLAGLYDRPGRRGKPVFPP